MPDGTRRINTTERWVDPYFGARVQQALGKRWSLVGYADIGGYGIGSDLSWQLLAGANYAFKPNLVGKLGYRHVQNDYEEDGFLYDMASAGFYLGLGVRW
jgi:opacity protein-like surface antigen